MTLHIRDFNESLHTEWSHKVATPSDVLEALGWVPCDTCNGTGFEPIPDEPEFDVDLECADCAFGYVPTDEMIEQPIAEYEVRTMMLANWTEEGVILIVRRMNRRVLVAAMRTMLNPIQ